MTEQEKWTALRKTPLSDHEPFCNYGSTNGREMCTCQVLVDITEGTAPEPVEQGTTRSDQRARRLEQRRSAARGAQHRRVRGNR